MGLYRFAGFTFESTTGELRGENSALVPLRHKVGKLLEYLVLNRDRLVTKDELLDRLWEHGDYRESSLTQSIRELRKLLGDSAQQPRFIKTFPQRGYQWICPVEAVDVGGEPVSSAGYPKAVLAGFTLALLMLIGTAVWFWGNHADPAVSPRHTDTPSLLVMPFINDTSDSSKDWVELGLSDMLANAVGRSGEVRVTPPAMAHSLLLNAGLPWPSLPAQVRVLLQEQGYDYAMTGHVRLHKGQQVLDFQLLLADGTSRQGSIGYPSLPTEVTTIAQQLLMLIHPGDRENTGVPLPAQTSPDGVMARQVVVQGISALQTRGPVRAGEYFQAAHLLAPDDPWVEALYGKALVLSGEWQVAQQLFEHLPVDDDSDGALGSFVHYWLAELAYRQGDDEQAKTLLNAIVAQPQAHRNVQIAADSYRLLAQIAWHHRQWQAHYQWQEKASEFFPRDADLRVEADKLFYLGNPISSGLEKDPQQDLLLSRERLHRALNYYTQLGHKPMMAASYFALAQNYRMKIEHRQDALQQALTLYEQLGQRYELAEVLVYATFFHIQLHQGSIAADYARRAEEIIDQLGGHRLRETLLFYQAFAFLDQGLDQTFRNGHPQNKAMLQRAIEKFEALLDTTSSRILMADTQVMLAWAYADKQAYQQALDLLWRAKRENESMSMETTTGVTVYSLMRVYLSLEDYAQVIALGAEPVTMRQQLSYLARAYYEQGDYTQAVETMERLKRRFARQWTDKDAQQLADYRQALETDNYASLALEVPAHAVYCESDWQLN